VTDSEIRVGGVASVTNPLGGKYGDSFKGVQAYFDMVNSQGGIYGRKLVLAAQRDDKFANNEAEVKGLLDQDKVFAVLPVATLQFTGADTLVSAGVPTFGWTINDEWQGSPQQPKSNLFGQAGSYQCIGCGQPMIAYAAKDAKRHKVGLLGYAVPQSAECISGWDKSFEQWGKTADAKVVFKDASLSYGTTDLSVQVSKMKDAGVDMVITCMDTNGVVTLAKEMKKQGLDAIQYLPNAYDQGLLDEYGDLFEGSYVYTSFTPLESKKQTPGMKLYKKWIREAGGEESENSIVGWINADLFVAGLKAAGPDFDRQKVIDAINKMTAYTANGLVAKVNWTTDHDRRGQYACSASLKIEDSKFVPQTGPHGEPFTCLDVTSSQLEPTYQG
jgi:ABC-type branched-subunit amino acid transport system substrate-binding protein